MQNRPLPLPHLPPQKKRRRPFSSSSFWLSQRGGGGEKVITTLPPLLPPPPRSSSVEAEGGTEFIALIFRRMGEMSGLLSIPILILLSFPFKVISCSKVIRLEPAVSKDRPTCSAGPSNVSAVEVRDITQVSQSVVIERVFIHALVAIALKLLWSCVQRSDSEEGKGDRYTRFEGGRVVRRKI